MAKMILEIGWKKYVVDAKLAITVSEMLSTAEVYETKYVKGEDGNTVTTHHVYDQEATRWMMEIMPESIYRMAKLAGKPIEEQS